MNTGTIKWFDRSKGYGFIKQEDEDEDVFFHHSTLQINGEADPGEGDPVKFSAEQTDDGLAAQQVQLVNGAAEDTTTSDEQETSDPSQDTTASAPDTDTSFGDLGLDIKLKEGVEKAGFTAPRPIQEQVIPSIIEGNDLVGTAPTGTGKTAAFLLPMIQQLDGRESTKPGGLILAPTHELAEQITEEAKVLSHHLDLTIDSVYGGTDIHAEKERLKEGVDLLVACPGRLLDHMGRNNIDLGEVEILVLDEADRMCDMGFLPDIKKIMRWIQGDRQNLFFSATIPPEIQKLADKILEEPEKVSVGRQAPTDTVEHYVINVDKNQKKNALTTLLNNLDIQSGLIFCRMRKTVKNIANYLRDNGFDACGLQGGMESVARDATLDSFRRERFQLLVATNVAARGLDVDHISHVINYDIPEDPDVYTHRLGRTGRSGREGAAYTLVTSQDRGSLNKIENTIGYDIDRKDLPGS